MEGPLSTPVDRFLEIRDTLRTTRSGHGGGEVCGILTQALDEAIAGLVVPLPDRVVIVAVGGYGRGELSLFSDVDLMVLHELDDPAELAAGVFRPLWDAKLRVGHSVRTVKESAAAAKEHVDTHTTLLTSRLVAGDSGLFARLMVEIAKVTKARPLRRHLVAAELERRQVSPYLLMATDLKSGRGGLRTLNGFDWERRREELIGRFSSDSRAVEETARESLLRVRNALHAVAGRAHDVFSPDLREQVANWLGVDVMEAATWLVEAMEKVDSLANLRWPEVLETRRRGLGRLVGSPTLPHTDSPPDREGLLSLLQSGERGRAGMESLWESGQLDDVLPEWGKVRTLPQLAPFHEHPVAAHLWRTIDEMAALSEDGGHFATVAEEVGAPDLLAFAAFLHDIGKGHGGDHAEVGAGIARLVGERLAMSADETELIETAVRLHLLLPVTATRRDIDDPAVIAEVAGQVGELRTLQVLYLLTVADSMATGPSMWNAWKQTLLRTLFLRCAARFGADLDISTGTTVAEAMSMAGSERAAELTDHLSAMPDSYLQSVTADDVLWHLDLIAGLDANTSVGVRRGDPFQTAVVVGRMVPGLRRHVAEVFAANRIDVLEARLFTRGDDLVLDSFRVRDDRTRTTIDPARWDVFRSDLEGAVAGRLDTRGKLAALAAVHRSEIGAAPVVTVGTDGATGHLVVTVKCADRVGRLAEIITVLDECGLEVRLAKIEGREGEVVDTFHFAGGVDDVAALEHRISTTLKP